MNRPPRIRNKNNSIQKYNNINNSLNNNIISSTDMQSETIEILLKTPN